MFDPTATAENEAGLRQLHAGDLDGALERFHRALQFSPENSRILANVGLVHAKRGNFDVAFEWYSKAYWKDRSDPQTIWSMAWVEYKRKCYSTAFRYLDELLHLEPGNSRALQMSAEIQQKEGDYAGAAKSLEKLVTLEPQNQEWQTKLAECRLGPSGRQTQFNSVGTGMQRRGPCDEAERCIAAEDYEGGERALSSAPKGPQCLLLLATIKVRQALYSDAIRLLLELLTSPCVSKEMEREAMITLAHVYERQRDYNKASSEINKVLAQQPRNAAALVVRGMVLDQTGYPEGAVQCFQQALAIDPMDPKAIVMYGHTLLAQHRLSEAEDTLKRALSGPCAARYGTCDCPLSIKGAAKAYLALVCAAGSQKAQAVHYFREAKAEHRNLCQVINRAQDFIARCDSTTPVQSLRALCDLDLALQEAKQLLQLAIDAGDLVAPPSVSIMTAPPGAGVPGSGYPAPTMSAPPYPSDGRVQHMQTSPPGPGLASNAGVAVPGGQSGGAAPKAFAPGWGSLGTGIAAVAQSAAQLFGATVPTPAHPSSSSRPAQPGQIVVPQPVVAPQPVAQVRGPSGVMMPGGQGVVPVDRTDVIDYRELALGEALGSGGFGSVYRGVFRGREVAIKKLNSQPGIAIPQHTLDELRKEIDALQFLRHPRLVQLIGVCLQPPNICIITEFMAGGSLYHVLHIKKRPIQPQQRRIIAMHVCEGIAFLHGHQPPVVHRDMKTMNVLLDAQLQAKLCDFGLTQPMEAEKTHISRKAEGEAGSPRYMAPEAYEDTGRITEKIDIWAVGCCLIEIFGGPLPYHDCNSIQQICSRVLVQRMPPHVPSSFHPHLRALIQACLNFEPQRRCTAQDLLVRLSQLQV